MIKSTKEAEFPLKQEGLLSNEKAKASSSSNSSQWLKLKDPRIVRVSRAFGGKDRHSKVCTIRGLRDRRVRLSVPTAIHLYDLQDRLGLSQPSKVVDWLLNAAKEEIDELPPLPIPAGNFTLGFPSLVTSTSLEGSGQNSTIWKQKSKEAISSDKETSINRSDNDDGDDDKRGRNNNDCTHHPNSACAHVLQNHLLSRANNNQASLLGLLNTMPFGNYQQWEANSLIDASQLGNHAFVNQNVVPFPSTLALSSGNSSSTSQILVYPPSGAITQPYFPNSHHHVATMEMNPRQINHYHQIMSSSSQNLLMSTNSLQHHLMSHSGKVPFSLDSPKKLLHSPNSSESYSHNKEQDFASSK